MDQESLQFVRYTYHLQKNINDCYKRLRTEAQLLIQNIELLEDVTNDHFNKDKMC